MRRGSSAENFVMMRRIALSLVKRDTSSKRSLKRRRKICGYDNDYLERLLFNADSPLARLPDLCALALMAPPGQLPPFSKLRL